MKIGKALIDGLVKIRIYPVFVIPRESGNPVKSRGSGLPPARERRLFRFFTRSS